MFVRAVLRNFAIGKYQKAPAEKAAADRTRREGRLRRAKQAKLMIPFFGGRDNFMDSLLLILIALVERLNAR